MQIRDKNYTKEEKWKNLIRNRKTKKMKIVQIG